MEIRIDESQLTTVVQAAILKQLDDGARETLIAAAISHLMTEPQRGNYTVRGQNPSPLQIAFNNAIQNAAHKIVQELVANDEEFKARLKIKISEALVLVDEKSFTDNLGNALSNALRETRD